MNNTNSSNIASSPFYSDLHRAAVELAESGLPVFPCVEGGKEPSTPNGFKNRTTDRATIDAWWQAHPSANVAIVPDDDGYAVIDIEAGGLAELSGFCAGHEMPRTFTNRTPHGGEHRFFAGSVQSLVRPFKRADGGKFEIDTRGRGGYVLMPPSRTEDGVYETIDESDVADLPHWIAKRLDERKNEHQAAPANFELDLKENIATAREWLARQPVPARGERNDKTFKAASWLKDLGVGAQTALDMLLPWQAEDFTPEEIERTVISAFENGQNEPGCYSKIPSKDAFAKIAANANAQAVKEKRILPQPVLFSDHMKREEKPIEWLIDGLVEKGQAVALSGPGGTHKSRTAVHWGLAISEGQRVYNRGTQKSRFVYFSYEDSDNSVLRRVNGMTRRLKAEWGDNADYFDMTGTPDTMFVVTDQGGVVAQPLLTEIRDYLRSIDGHKFVLLDSTYNVIEFRGATKSNEALVKAALDHLHRLAHETDSTIMYLWHPSRAGMERGDGSGWSVSWDNAPRMRLSLNRSDKRSGDNFVLKVEKHNDGPVGLTIDLRWDNGLLLPLTALGTDEAAERFLDACVSVAIDAAAKGAPLTIQKHLHDWQVTEIEYAYGKRPTQPEIKEQLSQALSKGLLRYIRGTKSRAAGYYPFDLDKGPFLSGEITASDNSE